MHSITFRLALWYLAILALLLTILGTGIYFTLSHALYSSLDESLKARAEQLARFKNIITIVAGGTFEEDVNEQISFHYYDDDYETDQLKSISHKKWRNPVDETQIRQALQGQVLFSTVTAASGETLRLYLTVYRPEPSETTAPDTRYPSQIAPSLEKWLEREHKKFERLDTDNSGSLSPGEMEKDRMLGGPRKRPGRDDRFTKKDVNRDGSVSLNEHLADEENKFRRRESSHKDRPGDGRRYKVRETADITEAVLVIARPTDYIEKVLELLLGILSAAIPLTVLLSCGGGIFLAKKAFKPVQEITNAAREIQAHDLSRRIEVTTKDELGRLAKVLNQMIDRLEGAFSRQKQFTGDASHELRSPLAVIQAEATLALQKKRSALEYQTSIETIARETGNMSNLIQQLLTLARADSGKNQLNFKRIHLKEFIEDFRQDAQMLCSEKSITLRVHIQEPLHIRGDKRSLRRLLYNLINNAVRYTPDKGFISLALYLKNNRAILTVKDTGTGIPPKDLPHIFKRFYRVDKARSRSEGGSGLGLAICKHIVQIHGGQITAKSTVGKGSDFYVVLPLTEKSQW